jgi:hypothetical protein
MSYLIGIFAVFIACMAFFFHQLVKYDEYLNKQPCSYFENTQQRNLPARCIEYYKAKP